MWLKNKEIIHTNYNNQSKRKKMLGSILVFFITTIGLTFTKGGVGYALSGNYFKQSYEILPQLTNAIISGLVTACLFYFFLLGKNENPKTVLVCPKCQKIKESDALLVCECGGRFEDIKTMQWVEDKKK